MNSSFLNYFSESDTKILMNDKALRALNGLRALPVYPVFEDQKSKGIEEKLIRWKKPEASNNCYKLGLRVINFLLLILTYNNLVKKGQLKSDKLLSELDCRLNNFYGCKETQPKEGFEPSISILTNFDIKLSACWSWLLNRFFNFSNRFNFWIMAIQIKPKSRSQASKRHSRRVIERTFLNKMLKRMFSTNERLH